MVILYVKVDCSVDDLHSEEKHRDSVWSQSQPVYWLISELDFAVKAD